jgi:hypothetical protein
MELDHEQISKAKELNQTTAAFLSKTITEEAYAAVLDAKQLTA